MQITAEKLRKGFQEYIRLRNDTWWEQDKHKLGKLLTVVDGAIGDPEQRKAIKDLVHDVWYGNQLPDFKSKEELLFEALTNEPLWNIKPGENIGTTSGEPHNPFKDLLK